MLKKKFGDRVPKGDILATISTNKPDVVLSGFGKVAGATLSLRTSSGSRLLDSSIMKNVVVEFDDSVLLLVIPGVD